MRTETTPDEVIGELKKLIEKIEKGSVSIIGWNTEAHIVEVHRGNIFREYEPTGIFTLSIIYKR